MHIATATLLWLAQVGAPPPVPAKPCAGGIIGALEDHEGEARISLYEAQAFTFWLWTGDPIFFESFLRLCEDRPLRCEQRRLRAELRELKRQRIELEAEAERVKREAEARRRQFKP